MAIRINLLPADYSLTGPAGQIVKFARPLSVILLLLFLVTTIGMGGFFLLSSMSLRSLTAGNDNLKGQVQAQNAAQQQIVLLKDRIAKIKTVQGIPTATKNLIGFDPLLGLVTGNSLVSELGVDTQKITASIVFKSNSELTNFLRSINSNTLYSSVSLATFNFSPAMGYQVSLSFMTAPK
jgi:hypothetical protein